MADTEMPCEFASSCGRKRSLVEEEEETTNEEEEDYTDFDDDDDNGSAMMYDYSDSSDYETLDGRKVDLNILDQYLKECRESDGFDITVYPGATCNQTIVPITRLLADPKEKKLFTDRCNLAIDTFNSQNAKNYELEEIVSVNVSYAGGALYRFTFQARDTNSVDAADATKTFQALVWDEIGPVVEVEFCRLKNPPADQGSPNPPCVDGVSHSSFDDGSPRSTGDAEAVQ